MREIIKEWALSLPRSYQDKITPEHFAIGRKYHRHSAEIQYAFLDLCDEGFFDVVHMVKCIGCGHVVFTGDNVSDALRTILDYNTEQWDCDFCERDEELIIDHCYRLSTNIK